jgi:hypothetical protein
MLLKGNGVYKIVSGRKDMNKYPLIGKCLAVGIILLFIGVAVAPSINSSIAKKSNDNDLVEVTSQACGIQGFGNTTVKLTKQQFQDVQQYLVDFRARLNQTTTREQAVPIFKDAVVELNRYGLLPKGIGVEQAQRLVLGIYQNSQYVEFIDKMQSSSRKTYGDEENALCLIAGESTNTLFREGIPACLTLILEFLMFLHEGPLLTILVFFGIGNLISFLNPIQVMSVIGLGYWPNGYPPQLEPVPASGWISTKGLKNVSFSGTMFGGFKRNKFFDFLMFFNLYYQYFVGVLGFLGIKIYLPDVKSYFYFGFSFKISVAQSWPWLSF